jgi:hypothetical protein
VIQIAPDALDARLTAIVDTAAPWCIFKPDIAKMLQSRCEAESGTVTLSTRLGPVDGVLYRVPLTLPADEGSPLKVEATAFLSPEWQGGNFIGYMGLLQRIRFAVDPHSNLFYFGDL